MIHVHKTFPTCNAIIIIFQYLEEFQALHRHKIYILHIKYLNEISHTHTVYIGFNNLVNVTKMVPKAYIFF